MAHITRETAPDPTNQPADTAYPDPESRGCLYALSQPPLILFLTVIGALLLVAGVHDQFLL
jgi:hypothetical protein